MCIAMIQTVYRDAAGWETSRTDASNTNIRFFTEIDLTPRPNTAAVNPNEINTSPVTDIIPVLPARTGCEHRLFIPNADPDFDSVR